MYRKASGGIGFSFNRFMTNAVPNFASDDPERDADLTLNEKDAFWTHQVSGAQTAQRSPMTLDAESALKAGITPHAKVSARIHKELVKNGVIDPSAPLGIDTTRITPKFAHQLAFVSVAVQRKVVGMLFSGRKKLFDGDCWGRDWGRSRRQWVSTESAKKRRRS
ncbi:uncharacterized protein Z520_00023 [Fonsecaea multimorphosa CBS 102226]|uniref:Uncharacterized protein n=1 Tax=Fonsecaea multimorphosa CBS 102226 TaxID=1442371 RepID=A0A0D2J1T0_9EURO|nr:uncharacterized protein Z520_00023 [Fonsecaea multimorphosa CBS 102226]KIY03332.1 hypothetical protein Z520_00023 [Fonsecaea multimorphosa CBS 102226]